MFGKRKKQEENQYLIIQNLHNRILTLQTENKSLYNTIAEMEEIHNNALNKAKAESHSLKQSLVQQKTFTNELKLKNQNLHTKLQKILYIIENKSVEILN